ncbi:M28 family peptidase [Massilia sp. CF038]|uniref:M28 family peptidase n=1 Tax=Massilia sp. CF038 TaxID=1881045 RepID=UPI0009199CB9|nr:M28 family peptidase [Massilia sp. CF038]SHH69868.1 Peptidase family M28 [Massilia sp. CF038]
MSTLPHQLERSSLAGLAIATLVLAGLAWLSLQTAPLPEPRTASAAPAQFSALRALRTVSGGAKQIGRAAIVARLHELGLTPDMQTGAATQTALTVPSVRAASRAALATTHDVLVRIKGSAIDRRRRPALLLAVHYDRPGEQLAVAAMLETLRALRFHAPQENDMVFLFAGADRARPPGARAFVHQHPWASTVGLVLQFDAIGNRGPLLLSTSRGGNGALMDASNAAPPPPPGNAALALVAALTPDLERSAPPDQLDYARLQFATPGGDAPGQIDAATLQQVGERMLALVRHFGSVPLASLRDGDSVHFELPLLGQLSYSAQFAWLLTLFTSFLFVVVGALAMRRSGMPLRSLGVGALVFVAVAATMVLIAVGMHQQLLFLRAGELPMSEAQAWERWYLLACMALGSALFAAAQRQLVTRIGLPATVLGAKLVLVLTLLLSSAVLPGVSYLLAWPLLGALFAYGALYRLSLANGGAPARLLILAAGGTPAPLLLAPALAQLASWSTPQHSAVLMLTMAAALATGGTLLASWWYRWSAPLPARAVCVR